MWEFRRWEKGEEEENEEEEKDENGRGKEVNSQLIDTKCTIFCDENIKYIDSKYQM